MRPFRLASALLAVALAAGIVAPAGVAAASTCPDAGATFNYSGPSWAFSFQITGAGTHNGSTSSSTCYTYLRVSGTSVAVTQTSYVPAWNGSWTDYVTNLTLTPTAGTNKGVVYLAYPRLRQYPDGNWNEWNYCTPGGCTYSTTWNYGYKGT